MVKHTKSSTNFLVAVASFFLEVAAPPVTPRPIPIMDDVLALYFGRDGTAEFDKDDDVGRGSVADEDHIVFLALSTVP